MDDFAGPPEARSIATTRLSLRCLQYVSRRLDGCWREIRMITRRRFTASSVLLAPSVLATLARADTWPTRAVRIIVPFAAGGPTDVIARIVGERLSKTWGQQVVIENRPGGGTNIANEVVAR